ncbi:major facilitator superfamily domain-containing protein [Aspergillus floccosus]
MTRSSHEHVSSSAVGALEGRKEDRENFTNETKDFPEGGLRAWTVVAGSFCIMFCTFGYLNTWGVYQNYYLNHQLRNYTSSSIAWIGSIQLFLQNAGGLIGGPLFDRYGAKVIIPPALLFVFSVMMASISNEYYQFMLAQGILGGLCNGLMFTPGMASVGQHFKTKRAAAMGIAVSGSSLGGVIFPIALNRMFQNERLGFGWTVRIVGFLILFMLLIAIISIRERLTRHTGSVLAPEVLRHVDFITTAVGLFFLIWGMYTPFFYIELFATRHGMRSDLASYMVSILNAGSLLGRLLPGFVDDRFGRFTTLAVSGTFTSILLFCWIFVSSAAGTIVFATFYGFCSGAIISLMSPCVSQITPDPEQIGTYLGMALFVVGVAGLTGTPICGAMIDHYGGFTQAAAFSGASVMFGAILMFLLRMRMNKNLLVPV